jgi:DedD protein
LDVQAKERLTGAVILVVLIVLVVPELLTGPRRAEVREPEASVEGAPMRSYTIELGERSAARPAQPRNQQTADPPEDAKPPPPAAQERATVNETRKAQSAGTEEPVPKPAERLAPKPPVPAPAADARAAPEAPAKGWSIQVGSFASRENADRLTRELRGRGFRSFVTEGESGGRKLYRVRVGPEADRAAARTLAERLRAAGRPGAIVPHP